MTKVIKKQPVKRDRVKKLAVVAVHKQFGCTEAYVYAVIRGDEKDGQADEIKKAYDKKYSEIKKVLI